VCRLAILALQVTGWQRHMILNSQRPWGRGTIGVLLFLNLLSERSKIKKRKNDFF
jgi:hypothetical protein